MNRPDKNDKSTIQKGPPGPADTPTCARRHKPSSEIVLLGIAILVVGILVLITHWPALSTKALSFDDNQYLSENRLVRNPGWSSAAQFLVEVLKPSTVQGYYQPLTMISLMLDYAFAKNPENLRPFRRTSLCLHVMNTALVMVILYLLLRQLWAAALVGLLFGLHPMGVESINWICERKTLLAAFFTFWSLVCYLLYTRKRSPLAYTGCLLTYVMALMSKPTSTPLPVLLLLLDYWPLRRLNWRTLKEKIPLFIIGGISIVITIISQSRAGWIKMPVEHPPTAIPLILCHNIRFYLYKAFWPVNLSAHYPFPRPLALSHPAVFAGLVTTCVLIIVLVLSLRRTKALLVGFLFFFIAILPTMQIIAFSNAIAATKYLYLPSLGLLLSLTWFLSRVWNRPSRMPLQKARQIAIVSVVAILAAGNALAARSYLVHWKDSESLYRYMIALTPNEPILRIGLGRGLMEKGKTDEAIEALREELRINPDYYKALNNLGGLLAQKGHIAEAADYFSRAVELKPDDFRAHFNLGTMLAKQEKFTEAAEHFRVAAQIQPQFAEAHYNLGVLLARQGRSREAIGELRTALKINPRLAPARATLNAELAKMRTNLLQSPAE